MQFSYKRFLVWWRQRFRRVSQSNSGDWTWLASKPATIVGMTRSLWRSAAPSSSYYTLLLLSGVIATLGLLANSSATIIGAMIVAPLMGPILGIAFSMVMGNRRLLKRSMLSVVTGVLLTILTAAIIAQVIGLETLTAEARSRIRPTLIDLGVALAAGSAGAFAKSRRGIADALPGVAIAVALVPPLSVIGIGIAQGLKDVTLGATLLFATNLTGIIFSGGLMFLWQRYGSIERAQRGLMVAISTLVVLGIPLGLSFQDLVMRERIYSQVSRIIRQRTLTFGRTEIRSLSAARRQNELIVDLEVAARPDEVSERRVNLVRDLLEQELQRSIILNVTVIPIQRIQSSPPGQ